jgi:hypothetical protein
MHPPAPTLPLPGLSSVSGVDGNAQSIAASGSGRRPPAGTSLGSSIVPVVLSAIRASFVDMLQATGVAIGTTAPGAPSLPLPESPDGVLGVAAGSSTSLFLAGFAALVLLAALAIPRLARRLDPASALWRPMPFISLLEQPG